MSTYPYELFATFDLFVVAVFLVRWRWLRDRVDGTVFFGTLALFLYWILLYPKFEASQAAWIGGVTNNSLLFLTALWVFIRDIRNDEPVL